MRVFRYFDYNIADSAQYAKIKQEEPPWEARPAMAKEDIAHELCGYREVDELEPLQINYPRWESRSWKLAEVHILEIKEGWGERSERLEVQYGVS